MEQLEGVDQLNLWRIKKVHDSDPIMKLLKAIIRDSIGQIMHLERGARRKRLYNSATTATITS